MSVRMKARGEGRKKCNKIMANNLCCKNMNLQIHKSSVYPKQDKYKGKDTLANHTKNC